MITKFSAKSWVICHQPNPKAKLRLFCLPYAGGGASIYRTWSHNLPTEIEVCAIQLPGRESRLKEPLFTRLSSLVETLAPVLHPYLTMPFAFFGHSMGALISFELVQQLRREYGLQPLHLFVSGRNAPQIPSQEPPLYQLPESAFVEELRRYNGTPELVLQNAELMRLMLPLLRADFEVCDTYVYAQQKALDCPISAFGGMQDSKLNHKHLAAWGELTNSSFRLLMLPGDHFFIQSSRSSLLQALSEDLQMFIGSSRWGADIK